MVWTGVAKSVTSRRRRRLSGRAALAKSTTIDCPCVRMSTPVWLSDRSMMTRPVPSGPRRKSMSRMAWTATVAVVSAKRVFGARAVVVVFAFPSAICGVSVTTIALPSITDANETVRFRFRTSRVRSPACTRLIDRRSPWLASTRFLPESFVVRRKSSAMRAGEATENDAGISVGATFIAIRTTRLPPCWVVVTSWIALSWAAATAGTNREASAKASEANSIGARRNQASDRSR